ncbi:hypothetical protein WA026_003332 [Henosepilachna vigintioctopunctata]|uniref:Uncharacterized protein n=1 Tax=Henosepilachna vigintioctopunctata TaxID=420089 RepID=A0AAW1TLV4_9CUCU
MSKEFKDSQLTVDDNLSLMFSSFRIETLVQCAVHGIMSKRLQQYISNASILRRSCILNVYVTAQYKKIGKTRHFISRTFVFLVILRKLSNLRIADDTTLLVSTKDDIETLLCRLETTSTEFGLLYLC